MTRLKKYSLVYLATPYTKYPPGHWSAYIAAAELAGVLMKAGVEVFSPVVHFHPLAHYGEIVEPHEFWMARCQPFMDRCDALLIGALPTWLSSIGIRQEETMFEISGKPVFHINPESYEVFG